MRRILVTLAVLAALAGTAHAVAGGGLGAAAGEGLAPRETLALLLIDLKLTDAQKREAALILSRHKDQAGPALDRVLAAAGSFSEVMGRSPDDERAVREAFRAMAAAGEDMAVARGRIMAELKKTLGPEQQAVLAAGRESLRGRIKARIETGRDILEAWIKAHVG